MNLIYYERYEASLQGWTLNVARAESLGHWLQSLSQKERKMIKVLNETKPVVNETTIKLRSTK